MDDFRLAQELENEPRASHLSNKYTGVGDVSESYAMEGARLFNQAPGSCFWLHTPPAFTDYTLNRRNVYLQDFRTLLAQGESHHQSSASWSTGHLDASIDSNTFKSQQGYLRSTSETKSNNFNDVAGRPQTRRDNDTPIYSFGASGELLYSAQDNTFTGDASMAGTPPAIHCAFGPKHPQPRTPGDSVPSSKENKTTPERDSREASSHANCSLDVWTVSAENSALSAATFPISCETRVPMILCGEEITYDLKGLDSDPRVITELLKVTKSERATFMVVAAFYRRAGNPQSAKAVLLSMIEEFTNRSVSIKELKPAFLMLSGCETDMAKLAQESNKDSSVVSGYHAAAKAWLQKVFGTTDSQSNEKEKPKTLAKHPLPTRPRAFSNSRLGSLSDVEKSKLEREIQTLRSRMGNQASQTFELRTSKRKLEEDIVYERNLRRKLQRELENTIKERDAAQKMERYALIQVKREVASRRNAEARLEMSLKEKKSA